MHSKVAWRNRSTVSSDVDHQWHVLYDELMTQAEILDGDLKLKIDLNTEIIYQLIGGMRNYI
jgi:hypothetical protein